MPSARDSKPLTPARRWLFRLSILAIPVLFFILLEAGLRLGGYGQSYPLFITVADAPGYLQANQEVVRRFVVEETREPENVALGLDQFGRVLLGLVWLESLNPLVQAMAGHTQAFRYFGD
jgi:hypothetical protein